MARDHVDGRTPRPPDGAGPPEPGDELDAAGLDPATIDTGLPLAELADLGLTPTPSFLAHLRRRIGRRVLASDVVDFAATSPLTLFMEFLGMLFSGFAPAPAPRATPPDPPRGDVRNGGSD